jgi:integrase
MRGRDVDLDERTLYAFPGLADATGKTRYRSRAGVATEDWAWKYIEPYVRDVPPNARVFTVAEEVARRTHQRISKAIGLPRTNLHHWRHSFAVAWLKRGGDHQVLKHQLGHAPRSTLIYTTYGTWMVSPAEIRERARAMTVPKRKNATKSATNEKPRRETISGEVPQVVAVA